MSVASPPRPRRDASPADALVNPYPLRYPDSGSPRMMTRRAWWLIAVNLLLPGSAQVLAGNRRLGRIGLGATIGMWTALIVTVLLFLLWQDGFWMIGSHWLTLTIVQAALIGYALLWTVLTVDTLRLIRLAKLPTLARAATAVTAVLALVLTGGGAAYASTAVGAARGALTGIFTQSGPVVPPVDGYYNILLLGADSGDGRDSMRFDSISVVSVNADTGAVTIFGIPRDMPHFPFAEGPMQDLYPEGHEGRAHPTCGWGSGINQLRTEVEICRDGDELYPDATSRGSAPGIEATKDAAEGILGIEIPFYAFIDMQGFAALVDALGGVEITVDQRLPKGGGPAYAGQPADDWAIGWIEVGTQRMDGDTAQWYARSRYTTNDWDRMKRQRELQSAILAQFTPANVLTRFEEILEAGTHLVDTDIPTSMLGTFADLALKAKEQPMTTQELTPEFGIDDRDPEYPYIRELVQSILHPPTPTPAPEG